MDLSVPTNDLTVTIDATTPRAMDLAAPFDLLATAPCGRAFVHTGSAGVLSMDVDSHGNMIVVGGFYATIDFGDGMRASKNGGAFVAKYDASCKLVFAKTYDNAQFDGVAIDGSDRIYLKGYVGNSVDVGTGVLFGPGSNNILIAALDASGTTLWGKLFGAKGASPGVGSLAVDAAGNVMVGGFANGPAIDFGGGLVGQGSANGRWIWLFRLDAKGAFVWSEGWGWGTTSSTNGITSIGLDRAGDLIVAGSGQGTIDFGGGPITFPTASSTLFLLKRSATTGAHIVARAIPGAGQVLSRFRVDATTGDLVCSGQLYDVADFGAGPIGFLSGGKLTPSRAFVARLRDDTLTAVWSRAYGSNPTTNVSDLYSLALSPNGEIDVTVNMNVPVDFGCGAIGPTSTAPPWAFALVHLSADGTCKSSASYGDGLGYGATLTPAGSLVYAGSFTNTIGGPGIAAMTNPQPSPSPPRLGDGFFIRLGQ